MCLDNMCVILVCVNYSDFLKLTCPHNKQYFRKEKFIVITSPEDNETIAYCKEHDIFYVVFNGFYKNGSVFNKSGAMYATQELVHKWYPNDWILLLDADIILPTDFDKMIQQKTLDTSTLYSLRRMDYATKEDWQLKQNLKSYAGMPFMGYMQLYHNKGMLYDCQSYSAAMGDFIFAMRFEKKELLDNTACVIHLGVDTINHEGRKSTRWD